jgi:hypothetical protein
MESDFDNAPDLMSPEKEGISPMAFASTSSLQLKRKPSKVPLVLTEVRRSDRLKGKSFGEIFVRGGIVFAAPLNRQPCPGE